MGNIGGPELLVILIVALLVLGPNRLPQAARSMGKAMSEFRRVTGGLQAEVRDAMSQLENEVTPPIPPSEPPALPPMQAPPTPPMPEQPRPVENTEASPPVGQPPSSAENA